MEGSSARQAELILKNHLHTRTPKSVIRIVERTSSLYLSKVMTKTIRKLEK